MFVIETARRRALVGVVAALLMTVLPTVALATSLSDLPAPMQAIPSEDLVRLFSIPFEPPNLAAEIARHHAWAPNPADSEDLIPGFVQVLRTYPGTADARRALLDIAGLYAEKGEWAKAEAPFRYVMEAAQGKPEARIAHLRLLELCIYSGAPEGVDAEAELRAAAADYVGMPEEGLARLLLGDFLVKNGKPEEGFAQYRDVLGRFSRESYGRYARIRYALGLEARNQCEKAREVLEPVLDDLIWGGRAYWVRGKLFARERRFEEAIADLTRAARSADSVWVRGQCHLELAGVYTSQELFDKARDCYISYLRFQPSREERLGVQLEIIHSLFRARRFVEAAEMAVDIEMEVDTTAAARYTKDDVARVKTELDPIIAQCEAALGGSAVAK